MEPFKIIYLRSTTELRRAAPLWDELWHRSEVSVPTARAEIIAQWLEQFAPQSAFCALAVAHGGRLVAALPLVAGGAPLLEVGRLPANAWGLCGELLIDAEVCADLACKSLIDGIERLPWRLLRLAPVAYESARWRRLLAHLRERSMRWHIAPLDQVGQVAVQLSWVEYQSLWSGNHRRQWRKARRRAERAGRLALDVHRQFFPEELDDLFRRACEIEDLSWKGAAGSSLLRCPGMFDWHLRQARRLSGWGQLQLTFLRIDRQTIAFEYGYWAKGTYYSAKVGYDPAYAQYSPGQLLRGMLLERFHAEGDTALIDFWGPLTEATAKWCTQTYPVGRVTIAPDRLASRVALAGIRSGRKLTAAMRRGAGFGTRLTHDRVGERRHVARVGANSTNLSGSA